MLNSESPRLQNDAQNRQIEPAAAEFLGRLRERHVLGNVGDETAVFCCSRTSMMAGNDGLKACREWKSNISNESVDGVRSDAESGRLGKTQCAFRFIWILRFQ